MSSSTDTTPRGRVLRDEREHARPALLDRELSNLSVRTFDPERIEAARQEGRAAGFAEGHAAGFASGLADARRAAVVELQDERRRLGGLLLSLRDQLGAVAESERRIVAAAEAAIAEGALLLARAVLDRELAVSTNPGRDAIVRALALVPDGGAQATVRMHPDDVALLGDIDDLALGTVLDVVADAAIEHGGCVLEAGDCRIDAQLGPAMERATAVLAGEEGHDAR